ncbi:MAG: hypothetical protein IH987_16460 [Planctomycetes bacterium]|nr:hypothetical protein [Planctomycetota bacterium]
MDTNKNGILEQSEMSDRSRYFIGRIAERTGIDPNKPIRLDKVFRYMDQRRREEEKRRGDRDREERKQTKAEDNLVPGFSSDLEVALVPDFSLPSDSPLLSTVPLEKRYNQRVLDRAERTLREYDKNRDGVIDQEEIRRARSWQSDPKESDLNGDGKLSKVELCERYVKWYGTKDSPRGGSRGDERSSSGDSKSKDSGSSGSKSKFDTRRYAESLLRQYDSNKNGVLEREEWIKMRESHHKADRNRNGKITLDELTNNLKSQYDEKKKYSRWSSTRTGSSRSSRSKSGRGGSYSLTSLSERLADLGVSSTSLLVRNDKNRDGQLQMYEYASTWNDSTLAEFHRYDVNQDGVITPQEWVAVEGRKK